MSELQNQESPRGVWQEKLHAVWHVWRICLRELTGRKYEPEVSFMDRFIPANSIVMQIGASDGRHSFYMARKLDCKLIICFEPSTYTYNILNVLKRLFRFSQIRTENLAIGAGTGKCYLITPVKRSGHLGLAFAHVSDELPDPLNADYGPGFKGSIVSQIERTSVDEYCHKNNIHKLDFIRCDVEGSELNVLRGAHNSLKRFRPVLLMEVHPHILKNSFGTSAEEVWQELEQLGYCMYYLLGNNLVHTKEFINEPWRDYFCVPIERIREFGLSSPLV